MEIDLYQVLVYLHLLCFVYWLGGDLGVYYSSGILIKPGLTPEARTSVRKVMHWLDQFPRVCMPLVIALGFTMGNMMLWFEIASLWLWLIWAISGIWVFFVIYLFLGNGNPDTIALVRRVDLAMRWVIALTVTALGVTALMGTGITEDKWLAAKLLIWAGTVFCGISSRYTMKPFGAAFSRVMNDKETPEDIAQMKSALYTTRIPIFMIWGLVAIAGAVGLWKPF
ncbi:MAG: hypothetical protein RIB43_05020 [Rhodospirillaceae bacterium]